MISLGLDPEPLAFRVRPQVEECVDSWLDRLTAAHETTRVALFRHLGIDPALAGMDLARGKHGLDQAWHGTLDHMVERLAWAVQTETETVSQAFLACRPEALLPRRLRHYACARCWYEARRTAKPLIVQREWILRACWRCGEHELPLSDMAAIEGRVEGRASLAVLADLVLRAERLGRKIPVRPAASRSNATILHYLVRPAEWRGLAAPFSAYQRRFTANLYHFSSDRVGLLALAHGSRTHGAHRFERLIAARLPERPTPGGGTLGPKKRPYRLKRCFQIKTLRTRIASDYTDLLLVCSHLFQRFPGTIPRGTIVEPMAQAEHALRERMPSQAPHSTHLERKR